MTAGFSVRPATRDDRFEMIRMGRAFIDASGLGLPFDPAWAERSIVAAIDDPDSLALVLDMDGIKGMLCATCVPSPLSPVKLGVEQVFWIDPQARGRGALAIIRAYEDWCSEQGCSFVGLVSLGQKSAGRLYERCGYARAEQHYMKAI